MAVTVAVIAEMLMLRNGVIRMVASVMRIMRPKGCLRVVWSVSAVEARAGSVANTPAGAHDSLVTVATPVM